MSLPTNNRIREVRKTLGLTQKKFCDRIAISNSYLAEIECSSKAASERILKLVVAEFNVDEYWIQTGEGSMFNKEVDEQLAQVISLFKSLDPKLRICAINQLSELADLRK
ncbi:MAG: helix-turn-helix transcriptional regulator [Defluviitaleaceae bacterium]|nr:helix-turn-helix transcriptional regulator [Defluviitaleaceae bacterium]